MWKYEGANSGRERVPLGLRQGLENLTVRYYKRLKKSGDCGKIDDRCPKIPVYFSCLIYLHVSPPPQIRGTYFLTYPRILNRNIHTYPAHWKDGTDTELTRHW
jgi:hypothetical protein